MITEIPQHGSKHEEGCTFLGRYNQYDLWWADGFGCEPTVIARWSSQGSDYSSGMCFGWMDDMPNHPLVEARKRAEAMGLDVRREYYAGKMKRLPCGMLYHADAAGEARELGLPFFGAESPYSETAGRQSDRAERGRLPTSPLG